MTVETAPAAADPTGSWPFANPVLTAAGCGGTGRDLAAYGALGTLGGFVTRSLTLHPRPGAPAPRLAETPSGLVNAVGLPNPGVAAFVSEELPLLLDLGATVVASVAGQTLGEYAEVTRTLARVEGVAAVEVNLSVPDPAGSGAVDVREPFQAGSVVAACRRDLPREVLLLAKIRSDVLRVAETARSVVDAGADAVVVGNAQPAAMPDGRPGGLSGPALLPMALRCVTEVRRTLPHVTVVGCGGISGVDDARVFLDAGATAVQIGTALFHDPTTAFRVAAVLSQPHGTGPGGPPPSHPLRTTGEDA
jgi:dihydroorotate dehydrogenase (NAD+) catalytic subunit